MIVKVAKIVLNYIYCIIASLALSVAIIHLFRGHEQIHQFAILEIAISMFLVKDAYIYGEDNNDKL